MTAASSVALGEIGQTYIQTTAEAAGLALNVGSSIANYGYPIGNALRYGADPTYVADSYTAIQTAIDCAVLSKIKCRIPGGSYIVNTTLIANHAHQTPGSTTGYEGDCIIIEGDGASTPLINNLPTTTNSRTILGNNTGITIFQYKQYDVTWTDGGGTAQVRNINFIQTLSTATNPPVQLDLWAEYNVFEFCGIYQAGTGNGLVILELTKGCVQFNNVVNRDEGASGLGNTRVGVGIYAVGNYTAGLGMIRKNTVRGWLDGVIIGTGSFDNVRMDVESNEFSTCYRGLTNKGTAGFRQTTNSGMRIVGNYFEQIEGTYCIKDFGAYTITSDNFLYPVTQGSHRWTIGIDSSQCGQGCVIERNTLQMSAATPSITAINIAGAINVPVVCRGNTIICANDGSASQIGILTSGADSVIDIGSNSFYPDAGWAGAGSAIISDLTTCSLVAGSTSLGSIGPSLGFDGVTAFPYLSRGAISLYRNGTALGNSALAANVLTLNGKTTYNYWNPTAGTLNVTSVVLTACSEGHIYTVRVLNSTGNALTFTASASLILASTFTIPNGKGGMLELLVDGGVAYERLRVNYP